MLLVPVLPVELTLLPCPVVEALPNPELVTVPPVVADVDPTDDDEALLVTCVPALVPLPVEVLVLDPVAVDPLVSDPSAVVPLADVYPWVSSELHARFHVVSARAAVHTTGIVPRNFVAEAKAITVVVRQRQEPSQGQCFSSAGWIFLGKDHFALLAPHPGWSRRNIAVTRQEDAATLLGAECRR